MADNEKVTGANGQVNVLTDETFIQEVIEAGEPVLVDFYADWCGPCKMMSPIVASVTEISFAGPSMGSSEKPVTGLSKVALRSRKMRGHVVP